jgi:hypothetical protein
VPVKWPAQRIIKAALVSCSPVATSNSSVWLLVKACAVERVAATCHHGQKRFVDGVPWWVQSTDRR